jgi:undecaprenyl-diphosphatase
MIDWLAATVLGLVQGATEYLPVSSSGHLAIAQHLFGLREPALLFDIVLHTATLLVVVWYYRRDVGSIVRETMAGLKALAARDSWNATQSRFPGFRLAWLIALGTLPTGIIGILFEERFERLFGSLGTVGLMLWVTGLILLVTRIVPKGGKGIARMRARDALVVGLAQGLAITPGISRSGATIATALLLGIERETAARYSFLLSAPSIVGALLLKIGDAGGEVGMVATTFGFLAALVSGYVCLALLVRVVKRGRLAWFAPYCMVVGLLALVLARNL